MMLFKFLLLILYTWFIGYISLLDSSGSSETVPSLDSYGIPSLDKMLHFAAYALFSCLAVQICSSKKRMIIACLSIVLYGGVLEFIQSTMPLREASLSDFIANSLGVWAGALFMLGLTKAKLLPRS